MTINDAMNDYAADIPVSNPAMDAFRRVPFAQRIAQTIATRRDPSSVVVGIYGAWGQGKTTVLNFIASELDRFDNVIPVTFDPWRFGDETQLLQSFFATLAHAVGRSLTTRRESMGKLLSEYASPIIPSVGVGPIKVDIKRLAETLSAISLDERRRQIERILEEEKKRVVVLMDDIDRLDRTEIQAIFKLVKLSANYAYTAYILAFDESIVAASLGERYGQGTPDAGYGFLEKIVQVPLHLPTIDKSLLRRFCFDAISQILDGAKIDLTEDQVFEFANRFDQGLLVRLHTPRDARRFANALAFSLPMLKGEVHPVDLMLIEGIRVFYPVLYDTIRGNPDAFLRDAYVFSELREKEKGRSLQIVTRGFGGMAPNEQQAIQGLITALFPRLSELFGNTQFGTECGTRWTTEQRVASRSYFGRYFGYTVPEGDVSDQDIVSLFAGLETESIESITHALRALVDPSRADIFLSKLFSKENTLTETAASKLAQALARVGDVFPHKTSQLVLYSPFARAAIAVQRLLYSIEDESQRATVARALIQDGQPAPFIAESVLHEDMARKDLETALTNQGKPREMRSYLQAPDMRALVAARMRHFAREHAPLFVQMPRDTPHVLLAWRNFGAEDETNTYLKEIFGHDPHLVYSFLTCYLTPTQDLSTGRMGHNEFDQHAYNAIKSVVNPHIVIEALQKVRDLDSAQRPVTTGSTSSHEHMAEVFQQLYTTAPPTPT